MDNAGNGQPNPPADHTLTPPRSPEQITKKTVICPGAPTKKGIAFIKEVCYTFGYAILVQSTSRSMKY